MLVTEMWIGLSLAMVAAGHQSSADVCLEGWKLFNDRCFLITANKAVYLAAERACRVYDARLAEIDDHSNITGFICDLGASSTLLIVSHYGFPRYVLNTTSCMLQEYVKRTMLPVTCQKMPVAVYISVPVTLAAVVIAILSVAVCRLSSALREQRSVRGISLVRSVRRADDPDVNLYAQIDEGDVPALHKKASYHAKTAPMPLPLDMAVDISPDLTEKLPATPEAVKKGNNPYSYVDLEAEDPAQKITSSPKMGTRVMQKRTGSRSVTSPQKSPYDGDRLIKHCHSKSPLITPTSEYSLELDCQVPVDSEKEGSSDVKKQDVTDAKPPVGIYTDLSLYDKGLSSKVDEQEDNKTDKNNRISVCDETLTKRPQVMVPVDRDSHFLPSPEIEPPTSESELIS